MDLDAPPSVSVSLDRGFVSEIARLGEYKSQVEQCFRLFGDEGDQQALLRRLWRVIKTDYYAPGERVTATDLKLRWIDD